MKTVEVRDAYSIREFCERWGFGETKVRGMIADGKLPALKVGGVYRLPRTLIDQWVADNATGVAEATR